MKKQVEEYYIVRDYNCAETTLRLANEKFDLGMTENELKMIGGFGGGMGCQNTCGALCAGIAAISKMMIEERAHALEGFGDICAEYVNRFEKQFGSTSCAKIKEKNFVEGTRCKVTVEDGAELLEAYLEELKNKKG